MRPFSSRVTVHMAASLDGFVARKDGSVDWLETTDDFAEGAESDPREVEEVLATIGCYVMGARTYETALDFEAKGLGWAYGATPTFVMTHHALPKTRESVAFREGDIAAVIEDELRLEYANIWVVGGGSVVRECLRRDLVDEVRVSVMPVLIGDGLPFFGKLETDIRLQLLEATAYKSGMVELWYKVRR